MRHSRQASNLSAQRHHFEFPCPQPPGAFFSHQNGVAKLRKRAVDLANGDHWLQIEYLARFDRQVRASRPAARARAWSIAEPASPQDYVLRFRSPRVLLL